MASDLLISKKTKEKEELSEDIIRDEVLTRLSPESLIRFRCVSKSWNSTILDFEFVKSHFTRQNPKNRNYLIHGYYQPKYIRFVSRFADIRIHTVPIMNKHNILIGYINGLICFLGEKKFILWNPAIRQYKKISTTPELLHTKNTERGTTHVYGFVWDSVENDYKLVMMCVFYRNLRQCVVYSAKFDTWSQLDVPSIFGVRSLASCKMTPCAIVKGCPYWSCSNYMLLLGKVKKGLCMNVFKFVAEENEFKLLPDFDCSVIGGSELSLTNLKDSLVGLVYKSYDYLTKFVDIYGLDHEGPGGVWSKMYNVRPIDFHVLCNWEGETLFQRLGEQVFCYDPETDEKKDVVDAGRFDSKQKYVLKLHAEFGFRPRNEADDVFEEIRIARSEYIVKACPYWSYSKYW